MALTEQDIQEISTLHKQWLELEMKGDLISIGRFVTDDVLCLPPGQTPVRGRANLTQWLNEHAGVLFALTTKHLSIQGEGNLAVKNAFFKTTFSASPQSPKRICHGAHIWVLHKEKDQQWRVQTLTWTIWDDVPV